MTSISPTLPPSSAAVRRRRNFSPRAASRTLAGSFLAGILGCNTAPPPVAKAPPPPQPIPVAKIVTGVEQDLATMREIYDLRRRSGHLLAGLNRKLQSRGFSRRVPAQPAVAGLESDLNAHARGMGLELTSWQAHVRPVPAQPKKGKVLRTGELWDLAPEQISGIIDARMVIQGGRDKLIAFIDQIPNHVERAVLITGHTPVPGGIRFDLQGFYERTPPQRFTEIDWPTIEARLESAGWRLDDPALPKSPAYRKLREAIKAGRQRIPDLRSGMDVANDFPRWFARAGLFDQLSAKILAVKGADLLRSTPVPTDAPFPPAKP